MQLSTNLSMVRKRSVMLHLIKVSVWRALAEYAPSTLRVKYPTEEFPCHPSRTPALISVSFVVVMRDICPMWSKGTRGLRGRNERSKTWARRRPRGPSTRRPIRDCRMAPQAFQTSTRQWLRLEIRFERDELNSGAYRIYHDCHLLF